MSTRKRNLAMLAVLCMLVAMSACTPKAGQENTTAATTTTEEGGTTAASTPSDDSTTAGPTGESSTVPQNPAQTTENTTAGGTGDTSGTTVATTAPTTTPTTAAPKKPESTAEIVAYFNAAANCVKTEKPGYTWTETAVIGEITGTAQWLVNQAVALFNQKPKEMPSAAKGANHMDFPAKGQNPASRLEASAVEKASCTEKNGVYEIAIYLKEEKCAALPSNPLDTNHGKVLNVLTYDQVFESIEPIKSFAQITSFAPTYKGSYVKCTVNIQSGQMKTAEYYFATVADIQAKVTILGNVQVVVPYAMWQKYTIG